MPTPKFLRTLFPILIIFSPELYHTCFGDVGVAGQYTSPYIPTECYSDDITEFPSNNLFAAAGEGIWDNGAACGRQYVLRCISAAVPASCVDPEATIQVKVVDYANTAVSRPGVTSGTTMLLSDTGFDVLVSTTGAAPPTINIEFQQV